MWEITDIMAITKIMQGRRVGLLGSIMADRPVVDLGATTDIMEVIMEDIIMVVLEVLEGRMVAGRSDFWEASWCVLLGDYSLAWENWRKAWMLIMGELCFASIINFGIIIY